MALKGLWQSPWFYGTSKKQKELFLKLLEGKECPLGQITSELQLGKREDGSAFKC